MRLLKDSKKKIQSFLSSLTLYYYIVIMQGFSDLFGKFLVPMKLGKNCVILGKNATILGKIVQFLAKLGKFTS